MPLETAVYKMTGLTAEHVGIKNRGIIARGNYADLVLFDPNTVLDNATISDPHKISEGIKRVWVNGVPVWSDGKPTGKIGGQVIKRN